MKHLDKWGCIFAVLSLAPFPGCHSGVIPDLPEDQAALVLALYHKSCGDGKYGGSNSFSPLSSPPNVHIMCKEPKETPPQHKNKIVRIPAQPGAPKKNVIFVEVPGTRYKHDITLVAQSPEQSPNRIIVLPQKASHEIRVEDLRQGAAGVIKKPEVYFLKSGGGGGVRDEYGVATKSSGTSPTNYTPPQRGNSKLAYPTNNFQQSSSELSSTVWAPGTAGASELARYVLPPPLQVFGTWQENPHSDPGA